ncbi:MAG: hypothetical protein RIT81_41730 [Deltaproteobacteria bacterium]
MGPTVTAALAAGRALLTKVASSSTVSTAGAWLKKNVTMKLLAGEVASTAAIEGVRSTALRSKAAKVLVKKD